VWLIQRRDLRRRAKKRVTKAKAKRAVTKKAAAAAGRRCSRNRRRGVIEKPVPGVTVATEFEATRVQGSEEE